MPATPARSPSSLPPTPVPSPSPQTDEADALRGIDETRLGQPEEGGASSEECEEAAARVPEHSDNLATPACAGAAQGEGICTSLERDETAFLRGWINPNPEPSMGAMSNCDTDSCRSSPVPLSQACFCLAHASAFGAEPAELLLLTDSLVYALQAGNGHEQDEENADDALAFGRISPYVSQALSRTHSANERMAAVCTSCPHSSPDAEEASRT